MTWSWRKARKYIGVRANYNWFWFYFWLENVTRVFLSQSCCVVVKSICWTGLLESLQIEGARVVTGALKGTSRISLLHELFWVDISVRRRLHKLSLIYKVVFKASSALFMWSMPRFRFWQILIDLDGHKKSFRFLSIKRCNNHSLEIPALSSLGIFKHILCKKLKKLRRLNVDGSAKIITNVQTFRDCALHQWNVCHKLRHDSRYWIYFDSVHASHTASMLIFTYFEVRSRAKRNFQI